jgi:hypothetical protein
LTSGGILNIVVGGDLPASAFAPTLTLKVSYTGTSVNISGDLLTSAIRLTCLKVQQDISMPTYWAKYTIYGIEVTPKDGDTLATMVSANAVTLTPAAGGLTIVNMHSESGKTINAWNDITVDISGFASGNKVILTASGGPRVFTIKAQTVAGYAEPGTPTGMINDGAGTPVDKYEYYNGISGTLTGITFSNGSTNSFDLTVTDGTTATLEMQ